MINAAQTQVLTILEEMYRYYESWATGLELACHKGCAACCTRNVTITGAEGRFIVNGLQKKEKSRLDWLRGRLQIKGRIGRPGMTTNQWAGNCLKGLEISGDGSDHVLDPCPFLDQDQGCSMYQLRPFACRCFGSSVDCGKSGMAEQPDILMEVNTVTLQLIEHLDQGNCWGNMLDVLPMMIRENAPGQEADGKQRPEKTGRHIHRSRPVPGFLVMPDQQAEVQEYLTGLFAVQIGRSNLGTILQINL